MTSINRYAAIAPIFVQDDIPYVMLVLDKGGERIPQKEGPAYITRRQWKLPGGGVHDDEKDPLRGALREYREETGCELSATCIVGKKVQRNGESHRKSATSVERSIYLSISEDVPQIDLSRIEDPEIERCQLFPLGDLPTKNNKTTRNASLSLMHWKYLSTLLDKNVVAHEDIGYFKRIVDSQAYLFV